jgi:glycosyltransferase involved in cell wall biosynthesis
MDLAPFTGSPPVPLPGPPVALFVGVLEAYKNIDGLAEAWRLAAPRVPGAALRIVGKGSRTDVAEALAHDLGVRWDVELPPQDVAAAIDDAWVLVLPSRSEGMGRVLVEAFCRGRGVVGTRAGSIPDLVADGVSGLLVEPDDPRALADALVRVLSDRALAERLAAEAYASAAPWLQTPEEYARRIRDLVA